MTTQDKIQAIGVSDKGLDNLERSGRLVPCPVTGCSYAIWSIDEVAALAERKVVVRERSPSIARDVGMRLASIVGIDLRGAQRMIQKCRMPSFDLETMIGDKAAMSVDALDGWLSDVLLRMPQVAGGDLMSLDALVLAHGRFGGLDRGTALALLVSGLLVPVGRKGERDSVCDLLFPHRLTEPGKMALLIEVGRAQRARWSEAGERR